MTQPALPAEQRARLLAGLQALRKTDDLWCVINPEGLFVLVEGASEAILGYPPAALLGRHYATLIVEEDRPKSGALFEALSVGGEARTFNNRCLHRDGTVRHLVWSSIWFTDDNLLCCNARDISDLVASHQRQNEQNRLLQLAGQVARLGGWSLDLRDDTLTWSDEIYALLEQSVGHPVITLDQSIALFTPNSQALILDTLASCRVRGGRFDLELQMDTLQGRRIDVRLAGLCETDEQGKGRHVLGALQDVTRYKTAERSIQRLTDFDPLTGLANRKQLLEALAVESAAARREARQVALLKVNADNFKGINSTLGHTVGDQLLFLVSERLGATGRDGDLVARSGDDNFVVLMRSLSPESNEAESQVRRIATRMAEQIAEPYRIGAAQHRLTASIGITLSGVPHREGAKLLSEAELALSDAKGLGGNDIRFFDPAMQAHADRQQILISALRKAIEANQLTLHFEPQVTAAGEVVGIEALSRWHDPVAGEISPAEFIPLAEQNGLIIALGRNVLRRACQQWVRLAENAENERLTVAVNVSAAEIRQADFVQQVTDTLASTGANPARLVLELTESVMLHDVAEVEGRIQALRDLGVRFALDDFGTGYSSLMYLKHLPLDQIKLDRSFVEKLPDDDKTAAVVRTIIALGENLGLELLAEGVESEAQRRFLLDEGCHVFQGYLFSHGLPADQLPGWLARWRDTNRACGAPSP